MENNSDQIVNLLSLAVKELGTPTTGVFAKRLWEICSGDEIDVKYAKSIYLACGYEPFSGYPLIKLD